MTIPVSPPPEPPALIRLERVEERSGELNEFQQAIGLRGEVQPAIEPFLLALEPQPEPEEQSVTEAEIDATTDPIPEIQENEAALELDQAVPIAAEMEVDQEVRLAPETAELAPETAEVGLTPETEPPAERAAPRPLAPTASPAQLQPHSTTDTNPDERDSFSIDADGRVIDPPAENPPIPPETPEINGRNLQEPLRLSTPIEVTADRQTFDRDRQIFNAIGNATMRYGNGLLEADRIQVNMLTRMARAEGNIALTRSDGSILRGDKIRYNFAQDFGTIENATGDITMTPATTPDTGEPRRTIAVPPTTLLPVPIGSRYVADAPQSDRFIEDQPRDVYTPGGFNFRLGTGREFQAAQQLGGLGTLTRFRFDAQSLDFTPTGWTGTDVRISTDPFSPPESELRADRLEFTPLDPLRDELFLTRPRLVFDDRLAVPILKRRYILDRSDREPPLVQFGFDQRDRDGFYIQRKFEVLNRNGVSFEIAPQFYVQRTLTGGDGGESTGLANFGFTTQLTARINNRTSLAAETSLTSLDFSNLRLEDSLRASVRLTHLVLGDHRLTGEYTFRNRQFNGSLGFRTVHSSLGLVLNSPPIAIGDTGIVLNYQLGANRVNADTDELELLKPIRDTNRVTLMRYQGSFSLDRGWNLWVGEALPATAEEGLRYAPVPVVPYVRLFAGVRGIAGLYSNGASEASLQGSIGVQAQFGHFSKPFLDYTSVFVRYSDALLTGQSPFPFDRVADQRIFSFGILQQIIGPLRFGFQTAINIDTNDAISTDYILEYSRRTYGIILSINPQRESGSLQLRINDFDWNGDAGAFSNRETCQGIRDLVCD